MILPIVSLVLLVAALNEGAKVYNVMNSGALGDGSHDDSQAFSKAWQLTCGDDGRQGFPTFYVPRGKKFLLKPSVFSGPCRSSRVQVLIDGTLTAPITKQGWVNCAASSWLSFNYVNNLVVTGSGTIHGQGQLWWKGTWMQGDPSCAPRPTALFFLKCDGLILHGLHHINPPRAHIGICESHGVTLSNFYIVAPRDSPNTDGIDIATSTNVNIHDASIQTGDDCIAVNSDTSYVNITRVTCGPGHGISIGSLGAKGEHTIVKEVHIRNCSFIGTMYGARIKTCQSGFGHVINVVYEDIILENTGNPIIIDQFYKPSLEHFPARNLALPASALKVDGIRYSRFTGTSSTIEAITFKCDQLGCTNIIMNNVNITSSSRGKALTSYCRNASGKARSTIPEVKCLSQQ